MPKAFKFKNQNVNPDITFSLTDTAKRLFAEAIPGQGFVGVVDLFTGEIHLAPVYSSDEAKNAMTPFSQQYAVSEASRTRMELSAHEKSIEQLQLTKQAEGQFMGFGFYKGNVLIMDGFANRSASLNVQSIEYDPTYLAINPYRTSLERSIPDVITKEITGVLCQELPVARADIERDLKQDFISTVKYSTEYFDNLTDEALQALTSEGGTIDLHGTLFKDGFAERLMQAKKRVNEVDGYGRSLLTRAVDSDNGDLVDLLLQNGASVHVIDNRGNTAISLAVENGNFKLAYKLYQHYATTDPLTRILILTANGNPLNLDNIPVLPENATEYQIRTMNQILVFAIKNKEKAPVIEGLIQKGASPDAVERKNVRNPVLIDAVLNHDLGVVQVLLERGAPVNAKNADGRTALMFAAVHGSKEMVKLLLQHGASVDVEDKDRLSIIGVASEENKAVIIEYVAQHRLSESSRSLQQSMRASVEEHKNVKTESKDERNSNNNNKI